ncbi:MAG TPA: glycosyltransferase family 39 protein [Thermoleophilaceae bacterium]|nr:glycosyltransferase family 39 protein [Thermoleophilaceae bacterium]
MSSDVPSDCVPLQCHSLQTLSPILGAYTLISLVVQRDPGDEVRYLIYAGNLTDGFYALTDSPNPQLQLWHGPGLPALLAPLVMLHSPLEVTRILVGPALLFATMVVFHRLVRLYLRSERAALFVTYGLALYLPFVSVVGVIRVEPLATLCFTLAAFFMIRSFRGGKRDYVWAGVALGALALSRVEYGYVLLVALLLSGFWLLMSRRALMARRSATALMVALLLCTPWLLYTYSLTSKPLYWGNSGGLSLYWMSAPQSLGDRLVEPLPRQLTPDRRYLEANRLKPLDQDARLRQIALENISDDPKHYLSNVVNNLGRLVFNSPYSFTNQKASMMLYTVPNALLLGVLSIAVLVAVRVRRSLAPEIPPIAVFTALGFAVHVPVSAEARFVKPLVPVTACLVIAVLSQHLRLRLDDRAKGGEAEWAL